MLPSDAAMHYFGKKWRPVCLHRNDMKAKIFLFLVGFCLKTSVNTANIYGIITEVYVHT